MHRDFNTTARGALPKQEKLVIFPFLSNGNMRTEVVEHHMKQIVSDIHSFIVTTTGVIFE